MEETARIKFLTPAIRSIFRELITRLEPLSDFTPSGIEKVFSGLLEEKGLKLSQLAQPVRVALTGRTVSPGIYEVMEILGKERTLDRLKKAVDMIESST